MVLVASPMQTTGDAALRAEIESLRRDLDAERARCAELAESVRQNELFTSVLAHDLRNPLGAMLTALQLLELRKEGDPKVFARIRSSGERMTRMIDQLLDFTRVRAGMPLEVASTELPAILDRVIDELRQTRDDNPIRVSYDGDMRGSWDPDRLAQVFSNLIGNAVQHGTTGGVDIMVQGHPDNLEVTIHNAGHIPPSILPQLFEPMSGGQRRRDGSRGLGLGLYITKHNVEAHGGTIDVVSSADAGTTTMISLPRHTSPEAVQRAPLPAERLRRSEQRLQMIVENVRDYAIFMLDTEGNIVTWNRGAELIKGYTPDEIIGQHHSTFYTPEDRERRHPAELLARAEKDGRVEEIGWRVRKDGTKFWADVVITALRDATGAPYGFLKVTRDLSEQHAALEQLRRSEERFRLIVEGIKDYAIFLLDPDGRVLTWNSGAQLIKGYTSSEIIGQHFSVFYPPEEAARCEHELAVARTEGRYEEESWRVRKDGTRFWANVVLTALRTPNGELLGFAKVTRDLTEHRKREEERLELARAQESIRLRDEFLAIASHELKTPLTGLQLQIDRLLADADERSRSKVQVAAQSTKRLADLIESLIEVSRIATGRFDLNRAPGDLVEIVDENVRSFEAAATRAGCALTLTSDGPLPGAWDRVRISQILVNLVSNAIKYAPGRAIEVTTARRDDSVEIAVRDHGPGISPANLRRIFDRFERAASIRHYGGLGLGLYVVREIALAHGGDVEATNPTGGGARIAVRLPLGVADVAAPEARDGRRG
jgi:PAS domain S-box-containing protein